MATSAASPPFDRGLTDALAVAGPPLLFALRLWASVCLAGADEATALRARARILVICETLTEHASCFDGGVAA